MDTKLPFLSHKMREGQVVYCGWLRKSPPEKKLRRYAWKKRWFVLRSGRMSGDPDVLEYYKNEHSKKPIRVINLSCCEQVDSGLTFNKKELQDSYVFDIKTSDRTFYLVAETEEEMNKWVRSICQICGFNQSHEGTDSLRNPQSANHGPRSSPAELSSSHQQTRERKSSAPSHSSQPTLFNFEPPSNHIRHTTLSVSAPQDYLFLNQCVSRKSENMRSASFSQASRTSFFMRSDTAVQRLSQGCGHCMNGVHGFNSLPNPSRLSSDLRDSTYDYPRSLLSKTPTKSNLTDPEYENDAYSFKTPSNILCAEFSGLSTDSCDFPGTPFSRYQIPRPFALDNNHNAVTANEIQNTRPPRPPKPGQAEGSPQQHNGDNAGGSVNIPRRNTLLALENRRPRASSCDDYDYPFLPDFGLEQSAESINKDFNPQTKPTMTRSESADSGDNYVPMNPGSSSQFDSDKLYDDAQNVYIPMSPGPHNLDLLGGSCATQPACQSSAPTSQGPTKVGKILLPPPVNRHLKPDRKVKPTPLDLRATAIIDELPFKSPVTKSWSRQTYPLKSSSAQSCRPVSRQSVTSTSSGDSEENYVPMQNPLSASPGTSGTSSPAQKKSSGTVDYMALEFQPMTSSPHRKPSTSSVASDEKVDYVQVDKEKTQALQSTIQEWTDVRQSSEPTKTGKQP